MSSDGVSQDWVLQSEWYLDESEVPCFRHVWQIYRWRLEVNYLSIAMAESFDEKTVFVLLFGNLQQADDL